MQTKITIIKKNISELVTYENNPRNNEKTVDMLVQSINDFGVVRPVLIDGNNVIIDGEAVFKAAQKLDKTEIPCVVIDELTNDQTKALRLVLNKTQEVSTWDFDKLAAELEAIDMNLSFYKFPEFKELNISDEDFFTDEPREKKEKTAVCPNCGKEFTL